MMKNNAKEILLKSFTFSYFMTMAIVVTYFPLFFDSKGYSKIQIGILYSIGPMMGIVSNLAWGYISDRFQTIKKVLLTLLIGQLVMVLLLFQMDSFVLLYVLMAGFFFFQQPVNSLNDSQLMHAVNHTGKSYASFRVWGSLGFAFAASTFGMLIRSQGPQATLYLSIATICLTLLLVFTLTDKQSSYKKIEIKGMLQIIVSRKFLWFLFLIMVMAVSHRMNDGFLALYLRQLGAPDTIIGYSWMVSAISEIPVFFFLSKYGHRYKELPLLAFAGLAYTVRFVLMSLVQDPLWVVWIQLLHSVTFGVFLFTAIRYIQQIVPDEYRASGQAIFAVTWSSSAGLVGGMLGGWIFDKWGGQIMYLCGAVLAFIAALGFLTTHLIQKEDS